LHRTAPTAPLTHLLEQAEEDICGKGALVCLVQDDDAVLLQQRVCHGLPQQHTISRKLDDGAGAGALLETDGVAHLLPQPHIHLVGHAAGHAHGGHSPRLGAHHLAPALAVARVGDELRDLGGLAAARLSHQDDGLAAVDHVDEVVLRLPHWQTCREGRGEAEGGCRGFRTHAPHT
jgi:hypothetical protein